MRTDSGNSTGTTAQAEFDGLYQRSRHRAYRHAYRILGNEADSEDVTQDAYLRAWTHFDRFDPQRSFETWLLRIVTNRAIEICRRRKRVSLLSFEAQSGTDVSGEPCVKEHIAPNSDPLQAVLGLFEMEQIDEAISRLSTDHRTALLLAIRETYSYEEIAARLNCPVGTIRSRVHRARTQLRMCLSAGQDSLAEAAR